MNRWSDEFEIKLVGATVWIVLLIVGLSGGI